ncbi:MAG TPA: CBS domain-containing protein [Myxococcales bacterium]|nr:CBS domain-containing protein [Myxococcales bacterium]
MLVNEIMSAPVVTIAPMASPTEAALAMERAKITHLVVTSGARIEGVLCDHDLRGARPDSTVAELMSAPAVTLPPRADVHDAAKLLRRRSIGSVVIVDEKRLAGIVTTADLLALLGKGAARVSEITPKWTLPNRGPTHRPDRRFRR